MASRPKKKKKLIPIILKVKIKLNCATKNMVPTCLTRSNDTFFFYNKFDHLNIFHSKGTFQGNLRTDKTSLKHTFWGGVRVQYYKIRIFVCRNKINNNWKWSSIEVLGRGGNRYTTPTFSDNYITALHFSKLHIPLKLTVL